MADGSSIVTWGIHAQGSVELLRLRGPNQLHTASGRSIFFMLAASTQIRTLITGEEYPAFVQDWLLASQDKLSGPGLDFLHLNNFACDAASVASQAREALNIDDTDFLSWRITDLWTRLLGLQVTLNQALTTHSLGEPVNLDNIHISNHYRTLCLRAGQHMLELVQTREIRDCNHSLLEQNAGLSLSLHGMIQSLVDGTLSTASIVLGPQVINQDRRNSLPRGSSKCNRPIYWCDILKLLWPLRILNSRNQFLRDDQAETARSMLRRVSEDFCIRQAVVVYHPFGIVSEI